MPGGNPGPFAVAPVTPHIDCIEPATPGAYTFAGVVARLKGASPAGVTARELARATSVHKGWMSSAAVSGAAARKAPLGPIGWSLLDFVLPSTLAVHSLTRRA